MSTGKNIGTLLFAVGLGLGGIAGCGHDSPEVKKKETPRVVMPARMPSYIGEINGNQVTLYKSNNPSQPDRMEIVQSDGVSWVLEDRDFNKTVDRAERTQEGATMYFESRDQSSDLTKTGVLGAATGTYQLYSAEINGRMLGEISLETDTTGTQ